MTKIALFKLALMKRKYSLNTVESYTSCLNVLINRFGEYPTISQLEQFLVAINNQNTHKQYTATIHHYFKSVLKKKISLGDIPYPIKRKQLPKYLSQEEIKILLNYPKNLKHQVIISILYGCGLRMNELLNLKWGDIDRHEMVIYIRNSKGIDRSVMLDESILKLLEKYYRCNKPMIYVLNGQGNKLQYSDSSINSLLKYWAKQCGIKRHITAHILRHSFATHLLDHGTDMILIQKLLGHKNCKTTEIYAQVSNRHIKNVKSPIVNL